MNAIYHWTEAYDFIMRSQITHAVEFDGREIPRIAGQVLLVPDGWTWYVAATGRTLPNPFRVGDTIRAEANGSIGMFALIRPAWFERQSYADITPGRLLDRCMIAVPAAGSSSSSRNGSVAIARAISSRRWAPYGRFFARIFTYSARLIFSKNS